MKNKHIELMIKKAKQRAKTWSGFYPLNSEGVRVYHCYENEKKYSWWDDASFKMGSQVVIVCFTHPRYAYQCKIEEIAFERCDHLYPKEDIFGDSEKIYKKVGNKKNRKKVIGFRNKTSSGKMEDWVNAIRDEEKKIHSQNDITITPYIKVTQWETGRGVEICIPEEVKNEESLNNMVKIVKRLLKRETAIDELYPDYKYTKEDWLKENHD